MNWSIVELCPQNIYTLDITRDSENHTNKQKFKYENHHTLDSRSYTRQNTTSTVWNLIYPRKPSWRKGKCMHDSCVCMKAPSKKSTANQRYAISHWWLIVTTNHGPYYLSFCKILSRKELENLHFHLQYRDCRPLAEERLTNIYTIYTSLKSTFCGLQSTSLTIRVYFHSYSSCYLSKSAKSC